MPVTQKTDYADAGFIVSAMAGWGIAALALLTVASLILDRVEIGSVGFAYVSSALSFLCAVFAGMAAGRARRAGTLYTAAVAAAAITTLLLTVGFIIEGPSMESAGVISVVSFTFAGCMVGAVFFGRPSKRRQPRVNPVA